MAILSLALGVGANTAIFSVVNAVLLRPLDFKSPANLYVLSMEDLKKGLTGGHFGYIFFQALRDRNSSLEGIAAFTNDTFNLVGGDAPEQLQAMRVSPSFFDVLGVHPVLGRNFYSAGRRAWWTAGGHSGSPALDAPFRRRSQSSRTQRDSGRHQLYGHRRSGPRTWMFLFKMLTYGFRARMRPAFFPRSECKPVPAT